MVPFKEKIEKPYDLEFLAMIKESEQQVKDGKTVKFYPPVFQLLTIS